MTGIPEAGVSQTAQFYPLACPSSNVWINVVQHVHQLLAEGHPVETSQHHCIQENLKNYKINLKPIFAEMYFSVYKEQRETQNKLATIWLKDRIVYYIN